MEQALRRFFWAAQIFVLSHFFKILNFIIFVHKVYGISVIEKLQGTFKNKPLQGMAPTECPLSACLFVCLIA